MTTLARSTSSNVLHHKVPNYAYKIKSLEGTNLIKCEVRRCYSNVGEKNDKYIEKRYKEIVKEFSFKVASFIEDCLVF